MTPPFRTDQAGQARQALTVLALLIWVSLSLPRASVVQATPALAAADRPNILMISVDDLNDWVGFLDGHPLVQTPHLDRLAQESVIFGRAYCAAPACGPSRAALFTGRAPHTTGMYSNAHRLSRLVPNATYFHQRLAENGFQTLGTGKLLHGNQNGPESFQTYGPGYNKWNPLTTAETVLSADEQRSQEPIRWHHVRRPSGFSATFPLNRMPRDRNPASHRIESFDWGVIDLPEADWSDTQCANWAIEQLNAAQPNPFFLAVGFYRPHQPLWAPKRYHDLYPPAKLSPPQAPATDLDDVPPVGQQFGRLPLTSGSHKTVVQYDQWTPAVSAYLACISYVDHQIGRVLDALRNSTHANNTVVVLWSDHGWQLGEKEHWGKFTAWERSARVPLLVYLPPGLRRAGYPKGQTWQQPVSLLDVAPTILELAGVSIPDVYNGESLVPILRGESAATIRIVTTTVGQGNHSLRDPRYRYIRYFDGTHELYDMTTDPQEWENLADKDSHRSVVQRFRKHVPQDPRASRMLRLGDYKAVVHATDQSIALFGPGTALLEGAADVASQHSDKIAAIRQYLNRHPEGPRHTVIRD